MFVNCPHCRTLVATDPATDLPPPFCPECAGPLRGRTADADDGAGGSATGGNASARDDADRPADADARATAEPLDAPAARRDSWWDQAAARAHEDAPTPSEGSAGAEAEAGAEAGDGTAEARPGPVQAGTEAATAPTAPAGDADSPPGATASALAAARVAPLRSSLPGFLRRREGAPARRDWRMPAAIAGLTLLLALQMLLADRDRLAGQAAWRPLLTALCTPLGCELPPWREPGAFTLLQRDVREHPGVPGALRVSATFRNDARWAQPWPQLQLSLADADGRVAGIRRFTAEEYLGGAPAQAELASGESATVAMDILEPAPGIVSFDFGFR